MGNVVASTAFGEEAVVVSATRQSRGVASAVDALGDRLTVEAAFALQSAHASFGGLSGLWLAADGSRMIAVSDTGKRWHARLHHDRTGRLTGLDGWSVASLPLLPGEDDGKPFIDAESLASLGADRLVVGYEGRHRLRHWPLDDLDATPGDLRVPWGLGGPSNSGMEALTSLNDRQLFAVGERVGAWGGEGLMAWVIDGDTAEELTYIQGVGFSPTAAYRLDDMIYLLERRFSLLDGFESRLVALPTAAVKAGARIEGTELAAFRWGDIGENFEGIAARRAPDGRILLYLLADDNFSIFQETLLVQLSLATEAPGD